MIFKKPFYRFISSIFALSFFFLPALTQAALPLTPAQRQNDLQEKILLRENINRAQQQSKKNEANVPSSAYATGSMPAIGGASFLVKDISLDRDGIYQYDKKLDKAISRYQNTRMGAAEIFSLLRDTTNILAEEGLVTSVVELIPGNIHQGKLNLRINWGYVQGWLIDGKIATGVRDRLMLEQAIPNVAGRILNMHDIDQALENLNNAGQSARIDVLPSSVPGFSWLNLTRLKNGVPEFSASVDNSGHGDSAHEGLYRYSANTTFNNVLAGVDTLSVMANTHHIKSDAGNADYYVGLNYSLPFGYNSFSLQGAYSIYRKPLKGYYGDYLSKGSSSTFSGHISRTVYRDAVNKLSLVEGLQYRRGRNYLAGEFINVSSTPFTTLTLGAQYVTTLAGGSFYSDLTWNKGISWFEGDFGALNNQAPTMVRYFTFNTNWNRAFQMAQYPFSFTSNLSGQYSPDTLLNDFRLAAGDDYTVRGFKEDPFLADSGATLNNTLNLPGWSAGTFSLNPFIGMDMGWLKEAQGNSTTLLGSAIGLNAQYHLFSSSFAFGVPLHYDHGSAPDIDPWVISLGARVSL